MLWKEIPGFLEVLKLHNPAGSYLRIYELLALMSFLSFSGLFWSWELLQYKARGLTVALVMIHKHFSSEWMTESLLLLHTLTVFPHCSISPGKHAPMTPPLSILSTSPPAAQSGEDSDDGSLLWQNLSSSVDAVYSHGHQRALLKAWDSHEQPLGG